MIALNPIKEVVEGKQIVEETKLHFDQSILDLDSCINKAVKAHEKNYETTVSNYLKHKEYQLKQVLKALEEKQGSDSTRKDMIISDLKKLIKRLENDTKLALKEIKQSQLQTNEYKLKLYEI